MEEIFSFEDKVFKLGRKLLPIFKLKYLKFEQDPLNIKDFMAQNIIFCLTEGYSRTSGSNQEHDLCKFL